MSLFNRIFRRKTVKRKKLLTELNGWHYMLLTTRSPFERWVIQGWIREIEEKLRNSPK